MRCSATWSCAGRPAARSARRAPRARSTTSATIRAWSTARRASRVPGVLVELADQAALARLDEYEDVGAGLFARRRATVHLDADGDAEAWVYVYRRSVRGRRRITSWGEAP
ncbi:MAG: gamma-glutamylcyclotransferase family protein [Candidatus Binatia bacterium]